MLREKPSLKKLNRQPVAVLCVLCAIALLMLLLNFRTPLVADDYRYCFSFADGARISSVGQIFPSMAAHRHTMNGRLIAHFLVQLFLMLPKGVFNIINALIFAGLICLVCSFARRGREHNALLPALIFGALWCMQPDFGQVFLWLDGSVNYLWCAALCLIWLRPQAELFINGRELSRSRQIIYILLSFVVGAYSENSTVAMVFMALLFGLLTYFYKKEKPRAWQYASVAAMLVGFCFMMFTPGEIGNKSAEPSLTVLVGNFLETARIYLRFAPLLLAYALMYALHRRASLARDTRILSLVFLGGSLAGHFVLTFALYCAGRSTYIALVLLLCACAMLFYELCGVKNARPVLAALSAVCLCCTLVLGYRGVADINKTCYELRFNEQIIREAAANGEAHVQLPRFYPETHYSAYAGLPYLDTEDVSAWENVYMARFYGVETVIGY